jgi:DNA repair protein RecN (Recombination protein N)
LIDALQLVTGARADQLLIREGAARTEICAEFETTLPAVRDWLQAAGFEGASDGAPDAELLMLRRTLDTQGKSRAWINGSPATVTQLRELGQQLLDIHGQHAWHSLTQASAQRELLDAYARINTEPLQRAWVQWRSAQHALEQSLQAQQQLQQDLERLTWQIAELDKLNPQDHEWQELQTQHSRLSHAQGLMQAAAESLEALDGETGSARGQLHFAQSQLRALAHVEPQFAAMVEVLQSSVLQAADVAHSLRGYVRQTDLDPDGLAELDARMSLWLALARRFKRPPEALPGLLQQWKQELTALTTAGDTAALQQKVQDAAVVVQLEAQAVSQARQLAAPRLAETITLAMQGLGMPGGRFDVALVPCPQVQAMGAEEVQFLVAGHTGTSAKPLGRVASGGELSRIALAVSVCTSRLGSAQTLIFDEVDSGIGGATAQTVGRLMKQLGQDRQVLAVTHLPQVAACADHHWLVMKQVRNGQTISQVCGLEVEQRITEIARMLGGAQLSETTLAHAKELLQSIN